MLKQKLPDLIAYSVIQLPKKLPREITNKPEILFKLAQDLLAKCANDAIILQGNGSLELAMAIYWMARVVFWEIVWQPAEKKPGLIVYSDFEPEEIIHPHFILKPLIWTDKEIKTLKKQRAKDKQTEISLDLAKTWEQAKIKQNPLKAFLRQLYAIEPAKKSVILKNTCPLGPALFAFKWFINRAENVYYENIKFQI
ncbi:MAG: hypothetical protein WC460_01225 [Patescibacteria group bacterium]